jgi:predicted dehydrogenase
VQHLADGITGLRLAYVVDTRPDVAHEVGTQRRVPWAATFAKALDDPRVTAVLIATPASTHPELIAAAANAGKHVFCEKPLALSVATAQDALDAIRAAEVQLQVGFHRRFDPAFRDAKRMLEDGAAGELRLYRSAFRDAAPLVDGDRDMTGDLFADATVHDFDAARWFAGEVLSVSALTSPESGTNRGTPKAEPDTTTALLRFRSGALGLVDNVGRAGSGAECIVELVGTRGTIRVGSDPRSSDARLLTGGRCSYAYATAFANTFKMAYRAELASFAEAVLADRAVEVGGADGLAAVALCEAASRSASASAPQLIHG